MTRLLVDERHDVAELLAGRPAELGPDELVDEDLRAVAIAVVLLRPWRSLVDEDLPALVHAQGLENAAQACEELRREAFLRRAA